jgi:hypothetical protein
MLRYEPFDRSLLSSLLWRITVAMFRYEPFDRFFIIFHFVEDNGSDVSLRTV